jgi:hypothetical protein
MLIKKHSEYAYDMTVAGEELRLDGRVIARFGPEGIPEEHRRDFIDHLEALNGETEMLASERKTLASVVSDLTDDVTDLIDKMERSEDIEKDFPEFLKAVEKLADMLAEKAVTDCL